jgi:hypothetical protein
MKTKIVVLGAFLLAAVLGAGLAHAGLNGGQQVNVWTDSAGLLNANGTFKTARSSSDSTQYIGCSRYAYDTGSNSITCYAKKADGTYASCFTGNDIMLRVAETLNPASYLYFVVNSDGSCDRVITVNASYNL